MPGVSMMLIFVVLYITEVFLQIVIPFSRSEDYCQEWLFDPFQLRFPGMCGFV